MVILRQTLLLICILLYVGCHDSSQKDLPPPSGILSEEELTKVLTDFSLAESAANLNVKNVVIQKTDSVYAFNPLTENKVRQSQYDSSIQYYSAHPEQFKRIYDRVMERLSEMQAKRNGAIVDSIAK